MYGIETHKVYTYVATKTAGSSRKMSFRRIFFILFLALVFLLLMWLAFVRNITTHTAPLYPDNLVYVGINDAQLSEKWSHEPELDVEDDAKFHVVTNIILVTHKHYNTDLRYDLEKLPDNNQLEERQREIEATLQANLNDKHIAAVHVLFFHPAVQQYLLKLTLKNSKKLVLHLTRRDPTVGVNLDYIQRYLTHKAVILMHMDNFLGAGWDDIDFSAMRSQRIMYALTRHSVTEKYPCNAAISASCNPGAQYLGSHDAFAFYADRNFARDMLQELDVGPNSNGIENVMVWYFQEKMAYKVLNSCQHLIVYHNHCIPIRNSNRKRFNRKGKNGLAPFTSRLV